MVWRLDDPQGNEAGKVKYDIVKYTRGAVLDIGCGPNKAFPHFIGIDNCVDTQLFGIQMQPDLVVKDASDLSAEVVEASVDAIFSSHLLEHIVDYKAALKNWWSLIKVGGHLCLYLPHRDLYPNIGTPGANPDHKHDFIPSDIINAMHSFDAMFDVVVNETRDEGMEYSFLLVMKKQSQAESAWQDTFSYAKPKPHLTACVVRYGAFGDMIQASNILPKLKEEGFHVTVMTTPKGQDILKNDPHIDDFFIQDDEQVPNRELTEFWKSQRKHFDRFINLSESIEGTLLAMPGRANHAWPDSVRRVELNRNYLEWTSQLAELKYESRARFYPMQAEVMQVADYLSHAQDRSGVANPFYILWALSGSSIHKFYPWMDAVIAQVILDLPDAVIIFSGDEASQLLEQGWENERRIFCESAKMKIRQTLTLATMVDCVVGPETGVLNAVAFEDNVAKVLLLSHSTEENLSKHWLNTTTLEPIGTPCYPCHRLHYGREYCFEHKETGAAMCQIDIAPDRVYQSIKLAYENWKED